MVWQKLKQNWFAVLLGGIGFILAAYICFYQLGDAKFENWDEAFYGEVTKQMMLRNDYLVPYWNQDKFVDKPPLNFWLNAGLSHLIGLNEFSIRFVSALSGFLVICITTLYAYRRWGGFPAFFAFITLAFNNIFIWRTRTGNLDALLSLLIMTAFLLMMSKWRWRYVALGCVFGLMFLQKAVIVVIPFSIFIAHELLYRRKDLRRNLPQYGILVAIFAFGVFVWPFLTYLQLHQDIYIRYFFLRSDQGVARLTPSLFNLDYIRHIFYPLQRYFFPLFVWGIGVLVVRYKKFGNITIALFAVLLAILLSFSPREANWYLVPSMPFWSLAIAYGIKTIVELVYPYHRLRILVILLILVPSLYVAQKTLRLNIQSVIQTRANEDVAVTAKRVKELSRPDEIVARLDFSYPATIYYSDRKTYYYGELTDLTTGDVIKKNVTWIVGPKMVVDEFEKLLTEPEKYKRYEVGQESILQRL